MENSCCFLLVLLGSFAISHLVQAQDQLGFISLDCGLPDTELSPYTEGSTGLRFSSDAKFIKTGQIGKINTTLEFLEPHKTMRYFPEGKRNCYNLNVEKDRRYLIRATFIYGNYDGLKTNPQFELHLGPNLWTPIDLVKSSSGTFVELLHVSTSNSLQICLVKNGTTTPLISALELRPLHNDAYVTKSGSLKLFTRNYFHGKTGSIRYPTDIYDRRWGAFTISYWIQLSTSLLVDNRNDYFPPKDTLEEAATPRNSSAPLRFVWRSDNPKEQFYVYSHFAELQDLGSNDTREFDLFWDGNNFGDNIIPPKLKLLTWPTINPMTCTGGKCIFELVKTVNSTLPPILNAVEVFTVVEFPQAGTNESDVLAITNIEATYGLSRISWQGDPCVPQEYVWDGLNCCSINMSTPPRITSLNLSSSGLNGTIAAGLQNLTQLVKLDLSYNNLTGGVPEFLGNMKSLRFINLRGNDLNGSIPQSLRRKGLELLIKGNPKLFPSVSPTKPPNNIKEFPMAIVVSVVSVAIIIVILIIFLVLRNKKPLTTEVYFLYPTALQTPRSPTKRRFTYSEVVEMTNNLETVLGKGGFGIVCHGILNGSEHVAVKVLSQSSTQGYKQFKAEVDLLLRVHHTNLVSLVGYCDDGDHLALIYEFLPNGDLRQHLSGKDTKPIISWRNRLRIALEAALGLEYLHSGCTPPMVHRDVKTTNILLDEQFKAKLADFGMSRSFPVGGESHVSTMVVGTLGYLDPEYYHTSRLSEKSDVYSFGIVLLEMITNQSVIDQTREKPHITEWVRFELNRGDITRIMDPKLHGDYNSRSVWRAIELAMSCANQSSARRPDMSQVVTELKECLVSENSGENAKMESQSSIKMSMSFDTEMFPSAR
ncbi:PREDICTED: probable LRR receptor-like serine/threonine-protein kinase PAM74 isoform X1 [Camelina sativa]|uniref:non-specific serine/threonine protein kinase n=1 Tax=Camelina sativa TaxID=90675 RepID=A0ABM1R910_CAMSA|nr:PREDICTED: probable LRR receptor-like serine/threonine-protein kinase PAM74 isoform X1 [Camelina sativa]